MFVWFSPPDSSNAASTGTEILREIFNGSHLTLHPKWTNRHRISSVYLTSDPSRFVSKIQKYCINWINKYLTSTTTQEQDVHLQNTASSNSGFLNSAKEWASELLSGQTKAGKVEQLIYNVKLYFNCSCWMVWYSSSVYVPNWHICMMHNMVWWRSVSPTTLSHSRYASVIVEDGEKKWYSK